MIYNCVPPSLCTPDRTDPAESCKKHLYSALASFNPLPPQVLSGSIYVPCTFFSLPWNQGSWLALLQALFLHLLEES